MGGGGVAVGGMGTCQVCVNCGASLGLLGFSTNPVPVWGRYKEQWEKEGKWEGIHDGDRVFCSICPHHLCHLISHFLTHLPCRSYVYQPFTEPPKGAWILPFPQSLPSLLQATLSCSPVNLNALKIRPTVRHTAQPWLILQLYHPC